MEPVYGLSPNAADRVGHLLAARPGAITQQRAGNPRSMWFVQCTSATAVGGSDVLDQCYPAKIVRPAADEVLPATVDAAVLLTLFDTDGTAATPTADAVYLCELTGEVATDGSGSDLPRRRAFGVAQATPASTSLTSGSGNLALTAGIGTSYTASGTVVTLPSAGTYLVFGRLNSDFLVSAMGGASLVGLVARLYNATTALAVPNTETQYCYISAASGKAGTATFIALATVAAASNLQFQAKVDVGGGSPTVIVARMLGADAYIGSHIGYLKLS